MTSDVTLQKIQQTSILYYIGIKLQAHLLRGENMVYSYIVAVNFIGG